VKPDVVVGVIGGGAVVGCLGAKMANTPSVGILITPADAKVCTKITTTVALPESNLFQLDMNDERIHKAFPLLIPRLLWEIRIKHLISCQKSLILIVHHSVLIWLHFV
jgi:UDP-N-acetylglucosamine--N-acetylmuramyl-(pentapeptide) pyrophosphoryl-undecaprenol N-acetylglucosamine transferase